MGNLQWALEFCDINPNLRAGLVENLSERQQVVLAENMPERQHHFVLDHVYFFVYCSRRFFFFA